jgi:hypothetical protein
MYFPHWQLRSYRLGQPHLQTRILKGSRTKYANSYSPPKVRWRGLQAIIRERANSPEMRGVPGGSTGLLCRRKVSFSQRHGGLAVHDYELDVPLLRELRRLEVAMAKALGEWQTPKYKPIAFPTSTEVPSGRQHRAALLIADGTRSDLEIAAACGINRRTLARWKEQPGFRTWVAEVRTAVFQ